MLLVHLITNILFYLTNVFTLVYRLLFYFSHFKVASVNFFKIKNTMMMMINNYGLQWIVINVHGLKLCPKLIYTWAGAYPDLFPFTPSPFPPLLPLFPPSSLFLPSTPFPSHPLPLEVAYKLPQRVRTEPGCQC